MKKASFKDGLEKARFYILCRTSKGIFKVICDGYYYEYKNVRMGIHNDDFPGWYVVTDLLSGMRMEVYNKFPTKKQLEENADYLISMKNSIPYDRYISQFSDAEVSNDISYMQWTKDEIETDITSQTTKS